MYVCEYVSAYARACVCACACLRTCVCACVYNHFSAPKCYRLGQRKKGSVSSPVGVSVQPTVQHVQPDVEEQVEDSEKDLGPVVQEVFQRQVAWHAYWAFLLLRWHQPLSRAGGGGRENEKIKDNDEMGC